MITETVTRRLHVSFTQAFFTIIISIVGGIAAFQAFFDNAPPYIFDAENSYVDPSPVEAGKTITVRWKLKDVNRVCLGSARRVLFNPETKVILATYDPTPSAKASSIVDGYLNRTFTLPLSLGAAPYQGKIAYRADVCYECNLFQKFVKPMCVATPNLIFEIK